MFPFGAKDHATWFNCLVGHQAIGFPGLRQCSFEGTQEAPCFCMAAQMCEVFPYLFFIAIATLSHGSKWWVRVNLGKWTPPNQVLSFWFPFGTGASTENSGDLGAALRTLQHPSTNVA